MKNILIYGRGHCAERFINLISSHVGYRLVGVTDTYVTSEEIGTRYQYVPVCGRERIGVMGLGYWTIANSCIPVCGREKISDPDIDYVVVCSFSFAQEIIAQLRDEYPDRTNICTMDQFFIKSNEDSELGLKENNLYRYFMYGKHKTMTKWLHYFEVYDKYFSKYRNKEIVFCEIGVFKGGSLQMWRNYFGEKATIIGIDIDKECMQYADKNIIVEIGSQGDERFWDYIKEKYPRIDILLDDGGHDMLLQKTTFDCMFPHLQDNGLYVCEDTHSSYFKEHGGEYGGGHTYLEYIKCFVDDINAFHSATDKLKISYNTLNMGGIHFYDSMVVVEKKYRKNRPISMLKENGKEAYVWPL